MISEENENEPSAASAISIQALIQAAIKTVEDLTELDRRLVPREIVEDLEAKLMVAEAKIAALQSDVEAKEDERKLYYDKYKQYGRKNRELKKKLARIESERPRPKKKAKKKSRSIEKPMLAVSTSPSSSKKSATKPSSSDTVRKKKRRSKSTSNAPLNPVEPSFSSMSPRDNEQFKINHSFSESGWSDDPPPLRSNLKTEEILNPNTVENQPSISTANFQDPQIEPAPRQEGFACRFCDPQLRPAPFRTIDHYRIHIKHVHFANEQPHFCRLCPYHSAKKSDVKRHEKIHSVDDHETKYICDICSARFSNKRALGAHCNNHSSN